MGRLKTEYPLGVWGAILIGLGLFSCNSGGANGILNNNDSCGSHSQKLCYRGDAYWYNSCGLQEELIEDCACGCEAGVCHPARGRIEVHIDLGENCDVVPTFSINGPYVYDGSGTDWAVDDAPVGTYTITFNPLSNIITEPILRELILDCGNTITFSESFACPAPDISQVVFSSQDAEAETYDLWVINGDGSNPFRLTNTPQISEIHPHWAPDGTRIAYMTSDTNIYVMNSDGSGSEILYASSFPILQDFNWSPDGQKLVVSQGLYNQYNIWLVDLVTQEETQLTFSGNNTQGEFSQTGNMIFWVHRENENAYSEEIYRMHLDGSDDLRITASCCEESTTKHTPDCYPCSFIALSWGHNIWIVDQDGDSPRQLTTGGFHPGPPNYDQPCWSHNCTKIIYVSSEAIFSDLYIMDVSGDHKQVLFTSGTYNSMPDWKP